MTARINLVSTLILLFCGLSTTSGTVTQKKTVGVMPFENINRDKKIEWLSKGIAETITTDLKNVSDLIMVERLQIKRVLEEIKLSMTGLIDEKTAQKAGQLMGADLMVVGGYQKFGDEIRITARFVKVETGEITRTTKVTGWLSEIFDLQDQIVLEITDNLNVKLSDIEKKKIARKPTINLKAYRFFNQGIDAYYDEDYNLSIKLYTRALRADPNYAEAHNNLGIAYYQKGWYEKAISSYRKAIELNPTDGRPYINLAISYYYKKKLPDEAISYLNKAIEVDPQNSTAYFILGTFYNDQELYKKAIAAFQKSLTISPDYPEIYNGLGIAYDNNKSYDQAISSFQQAIRLDPRMGKAYNNLGVVYQHKSQYKKAVAAYKKALKIDPDDAQAWNNLGLTYFNLGLNKETLFAYQRAIKINPKFAEAYYNLAAFYSLQGEKELAIDSLQKAIESGYHDYARLGRDKAFKNIRKEPGYRKVTKKAKAKKEE